MKKTIFFLMCLSLIGCSSSAFAEFVLTSPAFKNQQTLPPQYGYCRADGKGGVKLSDDLSPPFKWSGAPKGTKSFVMLLTDPDIPDVPYFDVKGKMIPKSAPRITGYQWILINIPATMNSLPQGAGSKRFVPGGKPIGKTPYGITGKNIYTNVFKSPIASRVTFNHLSKKRMQGTYGGYDGPCAPWNDEQVHHYTFTLYALDVPKLNLPENGNFTGKDVVKAMQGHILGKAVIIGNVTNNPQLMKQSQK